MKYKCKTMSMNKLIITHQGLLKPLCDDCLTSDCDNPIEKHPVSIMGVNVEMKLFVRGEEMSPVVVCEGYTTNREEDE